MRRRFLYMFFGTWLLYLAFLPPGIYSIDGYSMLAVADSLVVHHNVTVPPGLGVTGKGGFIYSSWYPLQSILAVPIVAGARRASSVLQVPPHYVESLSVTVLPALYTALTVAVVYLLALSLGSDDMGAWVAAIVYGFCTIALAYTRDFYADPLLALLMALGLLLSFRQATSWTIPAVTALALLTKPTGIILGPVLSVYLLLKTRRFWPSLLPAIGSAVGLGLYFLYNFYRFGDFRTFGQPWKFSASFVPQGVVGLLVSPGAGLVWFCPCVLLSVVAFRQIKTLRLEAWAIVALAVASLVLHSLWREWNGGWSWGPRLLLPVIPGLVALTSVLRNRWRRVLAVSAIVGFLLNAPNLISFYSRYLSEASEQGVTNTDLTWRPSRSPLLHQWPAAYRQIQDARHSDVRELISQRMQQPASTITTSRSLRVVGVWWWVLPVVHVPRVWGILASSLLAASGIWLLLLARKKGLRFTGTNSTSPTSLTPNPMCLRDN
jgi:dolichyl-phosphate-mannose-protein mannosyltransferase